MENILKNIWDGLLKFLSVAVALSFGFLALKYIAAPLSPVITFLFVLLFTFVACNSRMHAVQTIGGILVYVASWFTISTCGMYVSSLICCVGILMWFSVAIQATVYEIRLAQTFGVF